MTCRESVSCCTGLFSCLVFFKVKFTSQSGSGLMHLLPLYSKAPFALNIAQRIQKHPPPCPWHTHTHNFPHTKCVCLKCSTSKSVDSKCDGGLVTQVSVGLFQEKVFDFPFFSFALLFSVLGVLWRFVVWLLKTERENRESDIEGPTPHRETEGDVEPTALRASLLFELAFCKVKFEKDYFSSSHLIKALVDWIKRRRSSAYGVVAVDATTCCCKLLIRTSTGANLSVMSL